MESPFCGTTGMSSTRSRELNRGTVHVRLGLLEHELHDRRDVHITPGQYFYTGLPWRCPPPGVPTGWGANPTATTSNPNGPDTWNHMRPGHRHDSVFLLRVDWQGKRHESRHFHQLFHQLRFANDRSHRDVLGQDLGHFDDLFGIGHERVEELEHVWQLVHHLRHRCIENLHHQSHTHKVDNMLHSVSQDPLLAATRRQAHLRRPEKSTQCLPPGGSCLVPTPRPLPSSVSVELSGACVRHKGLGDRLLLMPPSSTQSSPSPMLGSSCHGLPAEVHLTTQVTHKEKWACLG